jgi:hypothetical protein
VSDELLDAVLNLTHFHREHEKFYGQEPRAVALTLQRHARALQCLADRWSDVTPRSQPARSPFEGSADLNDPAALQLIGVLFMEGEGEPAELTKLKQDLCALAKDQEETGRWLAEAMAGSWSTASALIDYPELADLLGERHRIIANDWQAAQMSSLASRLLSRAVEFLDRIDFEPARLREDLATGRTAPAYLYSAAELIGRAADLLCDGAGLVRENERRWRVFRARVASLMTDERLGTSRELQEDVK